MQTHDWTYTELVSVANCVHKFVAFLEIALCVGVEQQTNVFPKVHGQIRILFQTLCFKPVFLHTKTPTIFQCFQGHRFSWIWDVKTG